MLALARIAEDVGFDSVWLGDHLIYRFENIAPFGIWEGWSLLSALAATTNRVKLGTMVVCTGFRNPALLAKMADTVDEISGGRLILGLGAGWNKPEYDAFGYPFDHRVSRFEKAFQIIHSLLRTGSVDFEGRYYVARECELRPRGPRPKGASIMIGTTGERMLRLTARFADEWNLPFENRVEDAVAHFPMAEAACLAIGRDPESLARSILLYLNLPSHDRFPEPGWLTEAGILENPIGGSHEELTRSLRQFAAAGVAAVQLWINPLNTYGFEEFGRVLELLDQEK
jgi:alkanesulfonate monooxygenase SsuD/methylene tetrahydromethanopterin reductase-like flavin-dependent oxidoreductase (luciferase family)